MYWLVDAKYALSQDLLSQAIALEEIDNSGMVESARVASLFIFISRKLDDE
jgi:hypothetical protein